MSNVTNFKKKSKIGIIAEINQCLLSITKVESLRMGEKDKLF